jgi:hypothetical protein
MNNIEFKISNIAPEMWANIVNGFAQSSDAHTTLSLEEQKTLVGGKIVAYCSEVARANAINFAREQAAIQTALLADALIAQTVQDIAISVEVASQ